MVAYPEDWAIAQFNHVITPKARIGWQGLKKEEYLSQGYSYLIGGSNFLNGRISLEGIPFVSQDRYEMDPNIQVTGDDVLVTKDGTVGKVAIVQAINKPATLNSGVFVFRTKNGLLSQYLYWILVSSVFDDFIKELSAGSTIQHLYQKDLKRFSFPMPVNKQEQYTIAATLSKLDDYIDDLDALIEKKRNIRQGMLDDLMSGRARLESFDDAWTICTIGDCAQIFQGGTPNTNIPDYWGGDIIWVTPSELTKQQSLFIEDSERKITQTGLRNSSACLLPKGTILLCTRATIGELAIASKPMATNQGFKNLVCKEGVNNVFFAYLLLTLKDAMLAKAYGTTFLEISKKELSSIELKIPSFEEQCSIAETLMEADAEIATLKEERKKMIQIRDGAIDDLLTGRVRLDYEEDCDA